MVEARLRSVPGAMGQTGPPEKGEAAEGPSICLGADTWAVGKHLPDCHTCGALSLTL